MPIIQQGVRAMRMVLFALFALLFAAMSAFADTTIKINSAGEPVVVADVSLTPTGVTVSTEAAKYPAEVVEAYKNPGATVPVKTVGTSKPSGFNLMTKTTVTVGIVYDSAIALVQVVHNVDTGTKTKINPFFILAAVSVALMFLSSVLFVLADKLDDGFAVAAAFAAAADGGGVGSGLGAGAAPSAPRGGPGLPAFVSVLAGTA